MKVSRNDVEDFSKIVKMMIAENKGTEAAMMLGEIFENSHSFEQTIDIISAYVPLEFA